MVSKLGMTVDLCIACNIMLMLVSMTLTLMQGHGGSAKANILFLIVSLAKQATSVKLATTVGHFLRDLDFASVYMA